MKIIFGSDHAGFDLKNEVMAFAKAQGHEVMDVGTFSQEPVDYPDLANLVVKELKDQPEARGCLICGTGIGMGIAANRHLGIRAAVVNDSIKGAHLARAHNDANIICMGARLINSDLAKACLEEFLHTEFEGGRHIPRIQKLG